MFEFIEKYQLDIMLSLCVISVTMGALLLVTRYISKRRKWILIFMEMTAALLLGFDRAAYVYKGDTSQMGYVMVRLSNFMVFFLTSAVVLIFDLYLMDLLLNEGKLKKVPKRLMIVAVGASVGMVMVVISHFTRLYYYFDEENVYHRGRGFLLCYIVPVVFPLIQYTVIRHYRRSFSRLIYISLVLYILLPIATGIIQIFTYGLSIVNMSMVLVSVSLYIFTYIDVNTEAEQAHETEVDVLQRDRRSMKRLFEQTVNAFVSGIEKRDILTEGHALKVAETARKIAELAGKDEEMCDKVYYAAMLHDVGMLSISDRPDENEMRKKPVYSAELLSGITEVPYLSESARSVCENYDGSGYPDGLAGEDIPEISRIIAVADAFEIMMKEKSSLQVVREKFIQKSGTQFDPEFADIMISIIDKASAEKKDDISKTETELKCSKYKSKVSVGIPVTEEITRICFKCENSGKGFSAPSIVLFDSYDRHFHDEVKTIGAYHYLEFGEVWFDGHYVCTKARNMVVTVTENDSRTKDYEITAGRFEDHISLRMTSPEKIVEMIVALPDSSQSSYIGLTGENCRLSNIKADKTGDIISKDDIRPIVSRQSYIDRLESDLPNVQIDHTRSASTEGIAVRDELLLNFHTMSLPAAELVWHCPYIVIFASDDKKVFGENYREFALIKLNGEGSGSEYAQNEFRMKKTEDFPGWDEWKRCNKEGMECSVRIVRKGRKVTLTADNLGIVVENVTVLGEGEKEVYAAITGDMAAITDIRIR